MPRADSMDVINDSTTMTSRIDTMLLGVREDWDTSPEIKWNPGDPLFDHPRTRGGVDEDAYNPEWPESGVYGNSQYVRPIYQLREIVSERHEEAMRCQECLVDWAGAEAECWCCGQKRLPLRVSEKDSAQTYQTNLAQYMAEIYRTDQIYMMDVASAHPRQQRRQHEFIIETHYDFDYHRYKITGRYRGAYASMYVDAEELAGPRAEQMQQQIIHRLAGYLRVPAEVVQAYGRIERQQGAPGPIYYNRNVQGNSIDTEAHDAVVEYSRRDVELTRSWFTEASVRREDVENVATFDVRSWFRDEMRNLVREADDEVMRQAIWGDGGPITYPRAVTRYPAPRPEAEAPAVVRGPRSIINILDEAWRDAAPAIEVGYARTSVIDLPDEIPTATPPMPERLEVGDRFASRFTYRPPATRSPSVNRRPLP